MIAPGPMPGAGPADAQPTHRWQVDWGDQFCTLVRLPDEETSFAVAFRVIPGQDSPAIVLTRGGPNPAPEGVTAVALAPANRTFRVSASSEEREGGRSVIVLGGLEDDFWEALRGANELQLMTGRRMRRQIALPQTGPAVAALRQCTSRVCANGG